MKWFNLIGRKPTVDARLRINDDLEVCLLQDHTNQCPRLVLGFYHNQTMTQSVPLPVIATEFKNLQLQHIGEGKVLLIGQAITGTWWKRSRFFSVYFDAYDPTSISNEED